MAEESVLISIKLEGSENEAKVDQFTQSITSLQKANQELIASNKALAKSGEENSQAYLDNAKQIEINKQKITENTASRKGLISAIISEDNSIKGLSVRNAQLIKERNLINTSTEEGRKKIAQINAQIDSNNAKIKENSSALEKQRLNIGNYASALDGVVPGLSGFVNGLQGAISAGKAFIATPIGAALAAVAAVLATLSAAIKTNDALGDEFGKRWDQISSIFDVVLRRVGLLGTALVSLVKGDFAEAADQAAMAFEGVNEELGRAIFLTGELADRQNELDDAVNKFNATEKARQNQVDKLIIQSKDLSKTEKERLELSTKAEAILNDLTRERIDLAKQQSDIEIEAIGLKFNEQRKLNETTQEYGLRLLENSAIGGEEAEKISAAIRKVDEAEAESIRTLEKLQNQQNKLSDAKVLRIRTDSEQAKEIRAREAEDTLNLQIQTETKSLELTTSFQDATLQSTKALNNKITELNKKQAKENVKLAEDRNKAILTSTVALTNNLVMLFNEESTAGKIAKSGQALVNTFLGVTTVLKDETVPTLLKPALIAANIATGLAAVAKINAVKFAKGGIAAIGGILNGPSHAQGGIPFAVGGRLGFEAEGGEAIINKRSTAMFRPMLSAINQAGGGKAFATGGVLDNEIRSAYGYSQMFPSKSLPQTNTVLVLEDFEAKQVAKYSTMNKASVL